MVIEIGKNLSFAVRIVGVTWAIVYVFKVFL
jgi:hypothetical protein